MTMDATISLRLDGDLATAIDEYRLSLPIPPSRSETIRALLWESIRLRRGLKKAKLLQDKTAMSV